MWRDVGFIFRGRDADPGVVSRRHYRRLAVLFALAAESPFGGEANFSFGGFDGAEPDRGGDRSRRGPDETGNESEVSHQQCLHPTPFGIRRNLSANSDVC